LNATTKADPPAPEELEALIRLLDDDTPEVRRRVAERIARCGGDLSDWLAGSPLVLGAVEKRLLAELLRPGRRSALRRDWQSPCGGANAMHDDWDQLEAMLRVISDFLHDGISIRQPLPDALDLLAEEADAAGINSPRDLSAFLFKDGRLTANQNEYDDPRNSDLAWSIAEGRSNPLGLSLIFLLVAQRMGMVVEGVNFPGHFLTRIYEDGYPVIVDCFDEGRLHLQSVLLEDPEMSREERAVLRGVAGTGAMLLRLLNNLVAALDALGRIDDAGLVRELRKSLQ
jgi:hypothetical protein